MAPKQIANDRQVGGDHYRAPIQHWDYVLANDIPYLEAQIIKYATRWRKKNGHDDLRKMQHFVQKLLETEGVETELTSGDPTRDYVDQAREGAGGIGRAVPTREGPAQAACGLKSTIRQP